MKIVIFGANGGTGKILTRQALAEGHTVTAVTRHPQAFPLQHEQLRVMRGDVYDLSAVEQAMMFRGIHRHYQRAHAQMAPLTPVAAQDVRHVMIVPIPSLNQPALQSLAYARSITPDVVAVHVGTDAQEAGELQKHWEEWVKQWEPSVNGKAGSRPVDPTRHPHLVIIESPYRALVAPLLSYIDLVRRQHPNQTITVVLPEFVPVHWWDGILHNQTAFRLKAALLFRPGIVVTNVPYHLIH